MFLGASEFFSMTDSKVHKISMPGNLLVLNAY